jgi:hypothetical protein
MSVFPNLIPHGVAALVVCALIAACDANGGDRMEPKGTDSLEGGIVSADPTAAPKPVTVTLREYEVGMPHTLAPGAYLFTVRNEGSEPHSFEIEGNTMEVSLPTEVQPGETQTLPVDLAPGTYKVYCPVGEHDERGMQMSLTVSE